MNTCWTQKTILERILWLRRSRSVTKANPNCNCFLRCDNVTCNNTTVGACMVLRLLSLKFGVSKSFCLSTLLLDGYIIRVLMLFATISEISKSSIHIFKMNSTKPIFTSVIPYVAYCQHVVLWFVKPAVQICNQAMETVKAVQHCVMLEQL